MNTQVLLKQRPVGLPNADTWQIEQTAIPEPKEGEFLIELHYISLDPAMRGWLNDAKSYIPPVQIGEVMRSGGAGKVIRSRHPKFKEGSYVSGWSGVQQYVVTDGQGWHQVDPSLVPLPVYLGTLGMPGLTAYFGLLEVGQLQEGETVVVSGAAGAVGSVVGQIAKIKGCRVVGIAGGPEKCKYLTEQLGFDAAIDYKNGSVKEALKEACPKGLDVYFDNVGGEILDIVLTRLRRKARVVICGAISQYNKEVSGPSNYMALLVSRARMEGFVVMDYAADYQKAAMEMGTWMAQGKMKSREDIYHGIENFHETFLRLFSGEKMGKLILEVKAGE